MRFTAWLVLFATLLLWSGNWIVARAAREEIGPALATVGRLILVLAILLPFTFLAYAGWSYVVTRLGAARAGATLHLMPAMGVALSALFLGELPSAYHFAGIGLILTGTWVASTR